MSSSSLSNRLRVLSLHWGFTIGGVGKYAAIIDKVREHSHIDMQTIVILCSDWHCDHKTLEKLSAKEIYIRSRFDMSWLWRVSREINQIKPNLIMTHGFNGHFVAMATKLFCHHSINLICSYHGLYHAPSRGRKVFEKYFNLMTEYFIRKWVLAAVSVTEYSKKYLVCKGVDPNKIVVIHNGIDDSVIQSEDVRFRLRSEWGVEDDELLLGVASRLDPIKGVSYLIDAFSQLVVRNKRLKLVIVGTGTLNDSFKRYVHELGLSDHIRFAGFRSDVDDCLFAFDIFVLPSLAEYHSIALLEAMRAQKAIIATNVGGNTESVRHECEALIVKPADVASLSKAIERLAADPTLRNMLAKNACNRFHKKFIKEQMVKSTRQWILQCGNSVII